MSLSDEDYILYKRDMLKRKTKPYGMSNEELAREYYERFRLDHPESSIHLQGINQYICMDDRARKNLLKMLIKDLKENDKYRKKLMDNISEIKLMLE